MRILFLHGWHSVPGGVKPTYLKDHGHEVINPTLDVDFVAAIDVNSGDAKLVLLCPAWRKWGTVKTVRPDTVILHSRADDVILFADSEELAKNSGATPIEIGNDHRLADPEPLAAMLASVEVGVSDYEDADNLFEQDWTGDC